MNTFTRIAGRARKQAGSWRRFTSNKTIINMFGKENNIVTKLALILLGLLLLAVLIGQVWERPIDRDEGFWMYASWRVAEGDTMYRDFALPHTPLGALYYSLITRLLGVSLYMPRFINACLVVFGALAVFFCLKYRGEKTAAVVWLLLYMSSSLVLTWLVPVKAYAPSVIFITLSIAIWLLPAKTRRLVWVKAIMAGALLGLATTARLTAAVFIPALITSAVIESEGDIIDRITVGFAALLGALFCIPIIFIYWGLAGDAFLFNVWGIHRLFVEQGGVMGRLYSLMDLIKHPDFFIVVIMAAIAFFVSKRRKLSFPLIAGAFALLAYFVPGTTQAQYVVIALPPIAAAAALGIADIYRRRRFIAVALVALIVTLGAARPAAKILFDRAHKELVGPVAVYKTAVLLRENSGEDDIVFCAWPGYAALAERRVVPGWELGYFTDRIGARVDEETRRRYHLITYEETAFWLERGIAEVAVAGIDTRDELRPVLVRHFTVISETADATIYRFDESTLPEGEGRAYVDVP
ncbi:MAG: glycosyltransferase family 39 protein [bacterium]|nr:glycosyltransferase family 39 protein [bacterium]